MKVNIQTDEAAAAAHTSYTHPPALRTLTVYTAIKPETVTRLWKRPSPNSTKTVRLFYIHILRLSHNYQHTQFE